MNKYQRTCKDCTRKITDKEYTKNRGKCDRCSIGNYHA